MTVPKKRWRRLPVCPECDGYGHEVLSKTPLASGFKYVLGLGRCPACQGKGMIGSIRAHILETQMRRNRRDREERRKKKRERRRDPSHHAGPTG